MIIITKAKSKFSSTKPPSHLLREIEFQEECRICDRAIPNGAAVLRHEETKHIICAICISEVAHVIEKEME